jgi:DNA-binding response OmpR family regulator
MMPDDVDAMPRGSSSALRILICEDSPVERMGLMYLLKRAGYQVEEAADGESALLGMKNGSSDLLLLDLNLPDMDGFEVLGYVQKHRPGLPVILLSGMALDEIQVKINGLPNPELPPLLIKPVDPEQLLQLVPLVLSGQLPGQKRVGSGQ